MDRAEEYYRMIFQRLYYSTRQQQHPAFIVSFNPENKNNCYVYFIYAALQNISAPTLEKMAMSLVDNIPMYLSLSLRPIKHYRMVYFNCEHSSNGFSDFVTAV
jgi:hypothetical protein